MKTVNNIQQDEKLPDSHNTEVTWKEWFLQNLLFLLQSLPDSFIQFIENTIALFLFVIPSKRNKILYQNLDIAFPSQCSFFRKTEIARCSWWNLVCMSFNSIRFPIHQEKLLDRCLVHNHAVFNESLAKKRGALLLAPHMGDFMLSASWLAQRYPITIIMRLPTSNFWRKEAVKIYNSAGFKVIDRKNGLHNAIRSLSRNEIVIMAIDQHSSGFGIWIDFFGKPAGTITSPSIIALKKDIPVHFAYSHRFKDKHVELWITPEIELIRSGNQEENVRANTIMFSNLVENAIRRFPECWMWMHNRWKSPPK